MTGNGDGHDLIDARLAELARLLRGPRRIRAEFLAEARDGMADAAEAYRRCGLSAASAEHAAVREFGEPDELASVYQAEVSLAAGRRSALLLIVLLLAQPVVWDWALGLLGTAGRSRGAMAAYAVADVIAKAGGVAGIALAVLAALACGPGARLFGARRWPAVATGAVTVGVGAVCLVAGTLMTVFNPELPILPWGLPLLLALLCAPLAGITVTARRCFAG